MFDQPKSVADYLLGLAGREEFYVCYRSACYESLPKSVSRSVRLTVGKPRIQSLAAS